MLRIAGGWIKIITGRTAAWITWPRRHSQRSVLSKAPVPSALLKTGRSVVNYSHDGWTNIRGQIKVLLAQVVVLPRQVVVAEEEVVAVEAVPYPRPPTALTA